MFANVAGNRATPVLTVVSEADASVRAVAADRLGQTVTVARTIGFGALVASVAMFAHAGIGAVL